MLLLLLSPVGWCQGSAVEQDVAEDPHNDDDSDMEASTRPSSVEIPDYESICHVKPSKAFSESRKECCQSCKPRLLHSGVHDKACAKTAQNLLDEDKYDIWVKLGHGPCPPDTEEPVSWKEMD